MVALAGESRPVTPLLGDMVQLVSDLQAVRPARTTQEQAWMLLAARAVADADANLSLRIDGVAQDGAFNRRIAGHDLLSNPVRVENDGNADLTAIVTAIAAPVDPPQAGGDGFTIVRNYYDMDGNPVSIQTAEQNQRYVAVLTIEQTNELQAHIVMTDLLPAGLEIDNPRLVDPRLVESARTSGFEWLGETTPAHTEFLSDRFVAAFDANSDRRDRFTVAYVVRAATPGIYSHPAARVEDMYRPLPCGANGNPVDGGESSRAMRRLRKSLGLATVLDVATVVLAGLAAMLFDRLIPPPLPHERPLSTAVTGRWRLRADLNQVDPDFLKLLIAYEDKRFRSHPGVDPLAMVRAAGQFIMHRRVVSGGSTITMHGAASGAATCRAPWVPNCCRWRGLATGAACRRTRSDAWYARRMGPYGQTVAGRGAATGAAAVGRDPCLVTPLRWQSGGHSGGKPCLFRQGCGASAPVGGCAAGRPAAIAGAAPSGPAGEGGARGRIAGAAAGEPGQA